MIRCDEEGLPKVVQHIYRGTLKYNLKLFDDSTSEVWDCVVWRKGLHKPANEDDAMIEVEF